MENKETVERVAKAISGALSQAYWEREEPTDEDHRKAAVAAIKAVRIFTDTEVLAAARSDAKFDGRDYDSLPRHERERYWARSESALASVRALRA